MSETEGQSNNVITHIMNETESNDILMKDHLIENDKIEHDREKIKRRRSSFGGYLIEKNLISSSHQEPKVKKSIQCEAKIQTTVNEDLRDINTTQKDEGEHEQSNIEDIPKEDLAIIEIYKIKSQKLEDERNAWKKLSRARKQKVKGLKRDLTDAEKEDKFIEEDDVLSELSRELKVIVHTRPNYKMYLQDIECTQEKMLLTNLEIEKVSTLSNKFSKTLNIVSKASYKATEKKIFGDLLDKDPKVLLKEFLEVMEDGRVTKCMDIIRGKLSQNNYEVDSLSS